MGWQYSMGCLPMHNSVNFWPSLRILRVCTGRVGPDSLVRCDVITYQLRLLTST